MGNPYTSGRFNNVITPGLVEPIEDRNTIDLIKSGESQLREVMKASYEPNKLGSQIEFNAICLLQLGTELVGGKSLVRVKARIPEIHSILPIPSSPLDYNTIALYPTFQAATSDFGLASDAITEGGIIPGSKLVVSFDQMGNFSGGSLRKVFSWKEIPPPTTPPPATRRRQTARKRPQTSQSKKRKSGSASRAGKPNVRVSWGRKPPPGEPYIKPTMTPLPSSFVDIRQDAVNKHGGKPYNYDGKRLPPNKKRGWKSITGITLHQTAAGTNHFSKPSALRVAVSFLVNSNGKVYYMWDMDWLMAHAQSFNGHDVGIEIAGDFATVPGKGGWGTGLYKGSGASRPEHILTKVQIQAAKATIDFIIKEVAAHGGKIRYVHSHGQAFHGKPNGPGYQIWKKLGLWAQSKRGLSDGGIGFYIPHRNLTTGWKMRWMKKSDGTKYQMPWRYDGHPIPKEWDPKSPFPAVRGGKNHDRDDPEQKLFHKAKKAFIEGVENEELKKVKANRIKMAKRYKYGHHYKVD